MSTIKPPAPAAFTAAALEQARRLAPEGKPVPVPVGKTVAQVEDEIGRNALAWLHVYGALHALESHAKVAASPAALDFVRIVAELARGAYISQEVEEALAPLDTLLPKGKVGAKFTAGRKQGAVGRVRAWVRRFMAKHPWATAAEAWQALRDKPPKHVTVCENAVGRYVESDGEPDTGYRRFANLVSAERPK